MKYTFAVCPTSGTRAFQKELARKKIEFINFDLEDVVYLNGEFRLKNDEKACLENVDCLISRRFMNPDRINLEQFSFFSLFFKSIEEKIPVINSFSSHIIAVDKLETHFLLKAHGIPVPNTYAISSGEMRDVVDKMVQRGRQYITKPVFGSKGIGITKSADLVALKGIADRFFHHGEIFFLQEFIDSRRKGSEYSDLRLFVVNREVVASMRRKSADTWLTNVSQRATPEFFEPDEEMKDIAVKVADICGTFYAGVDMIESTGGELAVLEINSFPGWDGLQKVNDINIPRVIIDSIVLEFLEP
ncbi:MAG: ATP-grasp domain-containing protein [Candidatus Hodarchaeales archaeon]